MHRWFTIGVALFAFAVSIWLVLSSVHAFVNDQHAEAIYYLLWVVALGGIKVGNVD